MTVHLLLGIFSLLLMLTIKDKEKGLRWVFFFVTCVLCVRYQWGNDYPGYLEMYNEWKNLEFNLFDIKASRAVRIHEEYGWVILNRVFAITGLGFFGLIMALTIFENWVIHRMIVKYVEPNYYWVAVFFWLFSTDLCVNASMMRQFLCICLYLLVVDLMLEKKTRGYLWWSIAIILLGFSFHRSNIALLITLPLFYIRFKTRRSTIIWFVVLTIAFIIWKLYGRIIIEPYFMLFIEEDATFSEYMHYVGEEVQAANTGLGVIFRYVMFVVWLLLAVRIGDDKKQIIIILGIVSYFFEPVFDIAPMASRYTMYFNMMSMLRWAWLFAMAKKAPFLYVPFFIEIIILLRQIPEFYHNPIWTNLCLKFHTIFEAPYWM